MNCLHGQNPDPIAHERQSKPVEGEDGQHDGQSGTDRQRTFSAEAQAQEFNMQLGMVGHRRSAPLKLDKLLPQPRFIRGKILRLAMKLFFASTMKIFELLYRRRDL